MESNKKLYYIAISGQSAGETEKWLTDSEYQLIKDIFDDCESSYIEGVIYEIKTPQELYEELKINQETSLDFYHISDMLKPYYDNILCREYVVFKLIHYCEHQRDESKS